VDRDHGLRCCGLACVSLLAVCWFALPRTSASVVIFGGPADSLSAVAPVSALNPDSILDPSLAVVYNFAALPYDRHLRSFTIHPNQRGFRARNSLRLPFVPPLPVGLAVLTTADLIFAVGKQLVVSQRNATNAANANLRLAGRKTAFSWASPRTRRSPRHSCSSQADAAERFFCKRQCQGTRPGTHLTDAAVEMKC
jgi:hypothetical protein